MEIRLTHIGGPTALIEVAGWRLLTDPTFDPPGQSYRFGWGTGSRKLTGPALLHLGGVRFPISGPVRYTMTAREAVELCRLFQPRTVIPIHYEGWKHFREGREAIERELANAPEDLRDRIRWLPIGVATGLPS